MRKITTFYAWQSDTPQRFNRHLIRVALEDAAKRITDSMLDVELIVDYDMAGVPGTPPITDTILKKIAGCHIFVPDVTFVARTEGGKLVPNPNVMTEYGYALCAKTHAAMMPVMNTAFGPPEELPFDMGHLRHPMQYYVEPTAKPAQRRVVRQALSQQIEEKLRLQITTTQPPRPSPPAFPKAEPKDGPARFRASGEPIGIRWDPLLQLLGKAEKPVVLAAGPAIWLRVMPTANPGRTWPPHELKDHAIRTGSFNLSPFVTINGLYHLRAEDGMGICTLVTPDALETTSVAFAFETGEVWSIDTTILTYSPDDLPFLEPYYVERLKDYFRFLAGLGLKPPYRWIAGVTGAKGRRLQSPPPPGQMSMPGRLASQCLSEHIIEQGGYDGEQTPSSALYPFFKAIFDKCGVSRPDYLSS